MCGIAGICHLGGPGAMEAGQVREMTGMLAHRGPDESGVYLDDRVGLGHARLSIIDLSQGSQPIHNEDETLWIVYNGEVFNYVELRAELVRKGHRFYTSTDTEVILHLFEDHGPGCLSRLNGQFAFALWDSKRQELFLARDRLGIRPLHYCLHRGSLYFASEIKSIFTVDAIPREMDPVALDQVFTFWTTLPGKTLFKDIQELPPGHYLKAGNGSASVRKYWGLDFTVDGGVSHGSLEDTCGEVLELLKDSIRIRLRADVPVGCYVSGGLDSSGVASIVKNDFVDSVRTFGIRFEERGFDEGAYQDRMVSHLGTRHSELLADNEVIGENFARTLWHCEKPLLRTAPVPLLLLSRLVRESGFKVVLTGEGADEIFGGYNIFRETKVRHFWARQPESTCRPLLIGRLYPYIFDDPRLKKHLQSFFAKGLLDTGDPFYSHRIRWQNTARLKTFFSEEMRSAVGAYDGCEEMRERLPAAFDSWDPVARAQYLEAAIFLSNYLLSSQGDRVAMANSVEIRLPFLDYRLVELMGRIPSRWKIAGLKEKAILKRTFRDLVPPEIVDRPKHPYRAPIQKSLLNPNVPEWRETLSAASLKEADIFDGAKVGKLLQKVEKSRHVGEVDEMAIAGILSCQILWDQYVTRFPREASPSSAPRLVIDRRAHKAG